MRDAEPQIKPFRKSTKQTSNGQTKRTTTRTKTKHEYKMRHKHTNTENKRMRGHIFHASLTGESGGDGGWGLVVGEPVGRRGHTSLRHNGIMAD